ncbi:MAG TPA: FG-GAP-like repeat-containing protein [Candidatus Limnocylindrales bacterium]|nr:FG-GAP-like repeat-containing protein [Candidatus Limnocylindrales bacterium]
MPIGRAGHCPTIVVPVLTAVLAACGNDADLGGGAEADTRPDVAVVRKISQTSGGFSGDLADFDQFGSAVAGAGDVDGDGIGDIVVGADWSEDAQTLTAAGAVWLLFMNGDATVRSQVKIAPGLQGFDAQIDDGGRFGAAVASLGDVDGNGVPDLAVAAPWHAESNGEREGSVYILLLQTDGSVASWREIRPGSFGDADIGEWALLFGLFVAGIGDLDGDGISELAVAGGDPLCCRTDPRASGVYIVFLNREGAAVRAVPVSGLHPARHSVAAAGDVDGDGVPDLIASHGFPYVVLLRTNGRTKAVKPVRTLDEGDGAPAFSTSEPVASADLDGDGVAEIGFYSDWYGTSPVRHLIFEFLGRDGAMRQRLLLGIAGHGILARSIAGVGDLDGDGRREIALGTPRDGDGGAERGALWLVSVPAIFPEPTTTTTSTVDSTTTTTVCFPEQCDPGSATDWDVEVHLEESRVLGSLDLSIEYDASRGWFAGSGGDVECEADPELWVLSAFNDCTPPGCDVATVYGGVMTLQGFQGPHRVATCRYRSVSGPPQADDFRVLTRGASQHPNFRGVHAPLYLVVRPASE